MKNFDSLTTGNTNGLYRWCNDEVENFKRLKTGIVTNLSASKLRILTAKTAAKLGKRRLKTPSS